MTSTGVIREFPRTENITAEEAPHTPFAQADFPIRSLLNSSQAFWRKENIEEILPRQFQTGIEPC
jgi:hypothetical protein